MPEQFACSKFFAQASAIYCYKRFVFKSSVTQPTCHRFFSGTRFSVYNHLKISVFYLVDLAVQILSCLATSFKVLCFLITSRLGVRAWARQTLNGFLNIFDHPL